MGPSRPISYHPGIYFLVFSLANALLAYGSFSLQAKLWIGLLGLALPMGMALAARGRPSNRAPIWERMFFSPPGWAWALVFLVALAGRVYRLTDYSDFPLYDECVNALWAVRLDEKWEGRLFFNGLPPFYIWLLAAGFKTVGISLFWLKLLPGLLSLLSAFFFYGALRSFFSSSAALGGASLLAASFWPIFMGHFSHQAVLMVFFESVAFLGLSLWQKTFSPVKRNLGAAALGAWTGLGFYTYFGWPLVALLIGLTILAVKPRAGTSRGVAPLLFLFFSLLFLIPFAWGGWSGGYWGYLRDLLAFPLKTSGNGGLDPHLILSYFTSFLWEGWQASFAYNPRWGGFLNPVLGGFFFLGIIEAFQNRSHPLVRWLFCAFAVLWVPVLFANNANWFHVASLLPLFMGLAAVGFQALLPDLKAVAPKTLVFLLLSLSLGLDLTNLEKTREYANATYPSPELAQAYRLLNQTSRERGPGMVFADLWLKPWPPFLGFATTPFNVLRWEGQPLERASWAGILTNSNNLPFLRRRFPEGKAYWLSKDLSRPDGGSMLYVMDAMPERLPVFRLWQQASRALGPFLEQYAMVAPNDNHRYGPLLATLKAACPFFQADPFLESVYWEVAADLDLRKALWESGATSPGSLLRLDKIALNPCLEAVQNGAKLGYPAAYWYYQWGSLESLCGDKAAAEWAFRRALRAPLDFTDSRRCLESMGLGS